MTTIEVELWYPNVPVIAGCIECGDSIMSEWLDKDQVIPDPICPFCEFRILSQDPEFMEPHPDTKYYWGSPPGWVPPDAG